MQVLPPSQDPVSRRNSLSLSLCCPYLESPSAKQGTATLPVSHSLRPSQQAQHTSRALPSWPFGHRPPPQLWTLFSPGCMPHLVFLLLWDPGTLPFSHPYSSQPCLSLLGPPGTPLAHDAHFGHMHGNLPSGPQKEGPWSDFWQAMGSG